MGEDWRLKDTDCKRDDGAWLRAVEMFNPLAPQTRSGQRKEE
jgi:hypothetical protein